jgi:hypothetical protein
MKRYIHDTAATLTGLEKRPKFQGPSFISSSVVAQERRDRETYLA